MALSSSVVQELVRAVSITAVPSAPSIVEGVINVRGAIVPVIDIRARFGMPAKPLSVSDQLIIAWADERVVALRVDRALALVRLDAEQVQDMRNVVPRAALVAGVAKLPDGLVMIYDLCSFLTEAEAVDIDKASALISSGLFVDGAAP